MTAKTFKKLFSKLLIYTCCLIFFQINSIKLTFATKITIIEAVDTPDETAFYDEEGAQHYLYEFEGQVVLLVFWASWCAACSSEIPALDVLQKDFRKLPFTVLPVSEDYQGIETVQNFFKTHGIKNLKIYHDPRNVLFKELEVVGTPTSFLINTEGKIVARFVGTTDWYNAEVREVILSHIPKNFNTPKNSERPSELNKKIKLNPQEKIIKEINTNDKK